MKTKANLYPELQGKGYGNLDWLNYPKLVQSLQLTEHQYQMIRAIMNKPDIAMEIVQSYNKIYDQVDDQIEELSKTLYSKYPENLTSEEDIYDMAEEELEGDSLNMYRFDEFEDPKLESQQEVIWTLILNKNQKKALLKILS